MTDELAEDGRSLDYADDDGVLHVMCACGHRVSGAVRLGDKIALCPNCQFAMGLGQSIPIAYPERMPEEGR